jgi:sulfur carrier protein ThiS
MDTFRIRLRLFASLQKLQPGNPIDHEVDGPKTVGQFIREKGVPDDAVTIVMRNGSRADMDAPLADGDSLEVFPLIDGG